MAELNTAALAAMRDAAMATAQDVYKIFVEAAWPSVNKKNISAVYKLVERFLKK